MLKNKSLLYGLGLGLMAGALLLELMNTVANPQTVMPQEAAPLDKAQIKELALQHFKVYEKEEAVYDQAQLDQTVQQKVEEERQKLAAAQPAPAPAPADAVKETYIYVFPGTVVSQVGDMLVTSGVIADKNAFLTEMNNRGLNEKVKIGVHVFKGPQTLDQVLAAITGQ
ncbi:hypothetical protein PM3016_5128 [Paenibacillus mucilaginosus 3016]|uniref:Aminodeoxychorismate lyase n=1 Tax=Paenibacillus mucilaginosus 3016 TaxID=1116391 RepID=H6NPE0_9BACL|nr:hypothetical protein [Paenibacillus mucilaginosus]AFC31850.1 hypothetical protein PM3016_5128 [Paenibacillus mucilaginosus 3016]WFA20364.1 hypothetical protein ERY13_25580 [Paenibacillus mucilaginosus]